MGSHHLPGIHRHVLNTLFDLWNQVLHLLNNPMVVRVPHLV